MNENLSQELPDIEIVEGEIVDDNTDGPPDPVSLGLDLPSDKDEAIELLLGEIHTARSDAGSYLDDLRRVAADFDNYRKRTTREREQLIERASERVVASLLPVLDSFDAALQIQAETETEQKMLGGMRSTHAQLMDALSKEGLEPVPTWGETFDPECHEAVMSAGEGPVLTVSQELRRGYRLRGKLLRPALVALEASSE